MTSLSETQEATYGKLQAEMERRFEQRRYVEQEPNTEWLPYDDTQVGVEFAFEFLAVTERGAIASGELVDNREKIVKAMAEELEKSDAYRGNFIKAAIWAARMFDAAVAAVGE